MNEKNLLLLSTSYWHSPLKFRRHHFAKLASERGYQVLYVNPTFTLLSLIQDKDCRKCYFDFFRGLRRITPQLSVLTLPPLFPLQRKIYWINLLNFHLSGFIVRLVVRSHFRRERVTQIVYQPEDVLRIIRGNGTTLVYDCVDEHSEYPWNSRWKGRMSRIERRLLARCNLVSVSSSYLLQGKKDHCSEIILVPNGVDFALFNKAAHDGIDMAERMKLIDAPRIVYVGAIMEWFDYELVRKIAEHSPLWSIVLIGPSRGPLGDLSGIQNVHYLGIVQQSDLPFYLKGASVCIIPFIINDLVRGVNPLKLYEYLAAGKPVVSTALPQVLNLEKDGLVYIGKDHSDFICSIEAALRVEEDRAKDLRVELSRPFSWELIYSHLFNRIADFEIQASNGN